MFDGDATRGYLVECYWPGVSVEKLARIGGRARAVASTLGTDVVFLGSILVPDDETVFCLFEGREDDVRAVTLRAGFPFERIVESLRIDPGSPTSKELAR
ncbi:MAG: nickel-binding protein [Actinomycetota bacterium]